VVISLGLAPVLSLTTELIVGSAPPERAGAASGISETGVELGGALGIALLGSLGVSIYRREILEALPADVPLDVLHAARDTLGGAVAVSADLPPRLATLVTTTARDAFVDGMAVAAGISAIIAVGIAVLALTLLRDVRPATFDAAAAATPEPVDRQPADPDERHVGRRDTRRACPAPDA